MPGEWGKCRTNIPSLHVMQNGASFHAEESGDSMGEVGENLVVLWHQTPLHSNHSGWSSCVGASWCALSPRLVSLRLGVGTGWPTLASPASLFLDQQMLSWPQGNWKIFTAASPRHGREKRFARAKKIKIAKQNLTTQRHRMPGQGGFKNSHQRAQSFPFPGPAPGT